ncbi:MAG: hypothetical protein RIC50_11245 [Rhodospirillales bacterium]
MRYVKHFMLGVFLLASIGAGINLTVDPFDIFGMPRIDHINTHKSIGVERLAKPLQAVARKPQTVILGSSRCLHGVDPKDLLETKAYNLSIAGALADELAALANHVATATTAERLILCLDFVSFNDSRTQRAGFYTDVLGEFGWFRSLPRTVFSYAALKRSRNTLRNSLRGKPTAYRLDGFRPFEPRAGKAAGKMITPVASFLSPGGAYRGFPNVQGKLAVFENLMKEITPDLSVTIIVPPVHAIQLEAIYAAGLWPLFEDWKRGLTRICESAQRICWDFAGYSPTTTESLDKPPRNFGDSSHFTPHIGRRILMRISGQEDNPDFGARMTVGNVDRLLADIRSAREVYRRNNPQDTEAVRKIASSYGLSDPQ